MLLAREAGANLMRLERLSRRRVAPRDRPSIFIATAEDQRRRIKPEGPN